MNAKFLVIELCCRKTRKHLLKTWKPKSKN